MADQTPGTPSQTEQNPEAILAGLGIVLPEPPKPVASYVPAVQVGDLVYISGQVPLMDGQPMARGLVPSEVTEERAGECARLCAINALAVLKGHLGSLDRVQRIVRLGVFVACDPDFGAQPLIANGASELMQQVFGEAGRHARAAVGCAALPLNVPVEVEVIAQVR